MEMGALGGYVTHSRRRSWNDITFVIIVAGIAIIITALYGVRCAMRCTLDPLLWVGELRLRESEQQDGGTPKT